MAGSRFFDHAESDYAPVEGEALKVACSLEQTKFFTMGRTDLLVNTDQKPLVKLLGDSRLNQIENPRLVASSGEPYYLKLNTDQASR